MKKFFVAALAVLMLLVGAMPTFAQGEKNIVEIAAGDDRFETLVAAVQAAGLVDTLQGDGPFTVFAPTDDAFAALPAGTLEALLADTDTLTKILTYHVVSGKVMAGDVVGLDGQEVGTVQGENVMVKVDGGNVMINDANVIITDIEASNGVIHVIDKVIIPPSVAAAMASSSESAPSTMPKTGADNSQSLPMQPMIMIATGLLLLGGAYALRQRTFLS